MDSERKNFGKPCPRGGICDNFECSREITTSTIDLKDPDSLRRVMLRREVVTCEGKYEQNPKYPT